MNKIKLILYALIINSSFSIFSHVERHLSVELIEERINGVLFSYRYDHQIGCKVEVSLKEQWLIDNKPVKKDEYDERIAREMVVQITLEREAKRQERVAMIEFKNTQQIALFRKLLISMMEEIKKSYARFAYYDLEAYLTYSNDTICSEVEFRSLLTQVCDPIKHLLSLNDDEFSCKRAEAVLDTVDKYPKKLQVLFENTVKKAIRECDNTTRLKKLLEVVS